MSCLQSDLHIQMSSFQKLRSLFTRTFEPSQPPQSPSTTPTALAKKNSSEPHLAQFQQYLTLLPPQLIKSLKNTKRTSRNASLRPQLVKACYQNVPSMYFQSGYQIQGQIFTSSRKDTTQRTVKMQQHLDEVQLCLFNQISSRFDQILSVLRTIQSLQCIVVYNAQRLAQVRKKNMNATRQVSQKHLRIVTLLKKQQRLKGLIAKSKQIKYYKQFVGIDRGSLRMGDKGSKHYYQLITNIRERKDLYLQLQATKHFQQKVQQFQVTLKKSYSDTINDAIFNYASELVPYQSTFWQRKFTGKHIFQQDQPQTDGTVLLDQSVLIQQDNSATKIKLDKLKQKQILSNMLAGWRQGQYSVGNLKAAFDRFVKEKHARFLADCRNFAFQTYLREDRKKIQNPNIANIMQQMNINFCTKTFIFYSDMFRSLTARMFSLSGLAIQAFIQVTSQQLSMNDKQKITLIIDGLLNIVGFVFKIVFDKIVEVIELKRAHEAMDLGDFKQLVSLYEAQQEFIQKYLQKVMEVGVPQDHFLYQTIQTNLGRISLTTVKKAKQQKVIMFLNKTHRYIIQNQLRQSFQKQVWQPTDIPTFYYDSLHYLITGQSLNLRRNKNQSVRHNMSINFQSSVFIDRMSQQTSFLEPKSTSNLMGNFRIIRNQIIIDQRVYKVTQTLLLLLQIVQDYMHLSQYYPFAQQQVGNKILQLLRVYNTSSSQLIVFGGAAKLGKIKTKNITARHLALNSLCLAFLLYVIESISKRIHITQRQKICKQIQGQYQTTIKKIGSILTGKNNSVLNDINANTTPSKGTQAIVTNTRTLHDILNEYYGKEILSDIFTKQHTLAYLGKIEGMEIKSKLQAEWMKEDLRFYFNQLGFLEGVVGEFGDMKMRAEELIKQKFEDL